MDDNKIRFYDGKDILYFDEEEFKKVLDLQHEKLMNGEIETMTIEEFQKNMRISTKIINKDKTYCSLVFFLFDDLFFKMWIKDLLSKHVNLFSIRSYVCNIRCF